MTLSSAPPVDALNLIDCEVLYALCPFLMELRALLASSPSECLPGGSARHITPVSAGPSILPLTSTGKQLEVKLHFGVCLLIILSLLQLFFFLLPLAD